MPKLGDIFINNVKEESYDEGVDTTDHPVEGRSTITDHIEKKPVVLSITGIITGKDAKTRLKKLQTYMNTGKLLNYQYRSSISNVVITKMPRDYIVTIANGFQFSMNLKQIRLASPQRAYPIKKTAPKGNKGRQQPKGSTPAKMYVVKSGDSLSKIAGIYKISTTKLYEKNKGIIGKDPDLIYAGQKLIIPA